MRAEVKAEFQKIVPEEDAQKVGYYITLISGQLGRTPNDFLRQVISHGYPDHRWKKDDFQLREEYRALVEEVLTSIQG